MRAVRLLAILLMIGSSAAAAPATAPVKPAVASTPALKPAPAKPTAAPANPAAAAVAAETPTMRASGVPAPVSATGVTQPVAAPIAPSTLSTTTAEVPVTASAAAGEKEEEQAFTPFYAFHFSEGLSIPNIGGFFFGNNIGSTIGGRYTLNPDQRLFAAYDLVYAGPGMRPQEGREFQERSVDHSVSAGHAWKLSPAYLLNSRVQYVHEFRRSGANEQMGNGLYDYWSLGLSESVDLGLVPGVPLSCGLSYAYVRFPNYTDLMQEFQSASVSSELSGGQQDYQKIRLDADAKFGGELGHGWMSVSMLSFVKATVVTDAGTAGGTKQRDLVADLGGSWKFTLARDGGQALTAEPSLTVDMKNSNQNFLRFRYFGDTSPSFIKGNYNYVSPSLGVPVRWEFKSGRSLFFIPSYTLLAYGSRPPRDAANSYLTDKKQMNQTTMLTLGYAAQLHAYTSWSFGYTLQIQKSNNRFERFLPYNYTGHVVFTSLNITY